MSGLKFDIKYHTDVAKLDIKKLSSSMKKRVKTSIENKLMIEPSLFGVPLRKSLKGYRKLRVGDYRIVFKIIKKTVIILLIQHRKEIYKNTDKRL